VSAPDLPRFVVASGGMDVLDTWHAHRIVHSFAAYRGEAQRLARIAAVKRCAELEAWHAEAMRDGT
jgi:hypothetical protein